MACVGEMAVSLVLDIAADIVSGQWRQNADAAEQDGSFPLLRPDSNSVCSIFAGCAAGIAVFAAVSIITTIASGGAASPAMIAAGLVGALAYVALCCHCPCKLSPTICYPIKALGIC